MGNGKHWIGFDLGGTKMLAALFDGGFNLCSRRRRKTKGADGALAGVDRMAETIDQLLDNAGVSIDSIRGIGVGVPGPVDMVTGRIPDIPNLPWKNAKVRETLGKRFDCEVVLLNDVDAGLYGEYVYGAATGARCVLGVFPGTGIGGGCIYEGMILRGAGLSCMEIGHMQVLPEGPLCGCGQKGCLEAVAGRLAIAGAAALAAYRGEAPNLLADAGTKISDIRSGVLARSIKAGDRVVERIVRDAAGWIGIGVANTVNLLLPDTILLGGGLVEELPDLFVEEVTRAARSRVMPAFKGMFKVKTAQLGDDACVWGAATWARKIIEKEKNNTN